MKLGCWAKTTLAAISALAVVCTAGAASSATLRGLRVGQHLAFSRIVLDFEGRPTRYRLHQDTSGGLLWVVVPADVEPGVRLPSPLPREVKELRLSPSDESGGSRLGVRIPQGSRIRAFPLERDLSGGFRVVVDVMRPAAGGKPARIERGATIAGHPWRALRDLPVLPAVQLSRGIQGDRPSRRPPDSPFPPLQTLTPGLSPTTEPRPAVTASGPPESPPPLTLAQVPGDPSSAAKAGTEDTSLTRRILDFPKVVFEDAVEAIKAPVRWDLSDWLIMGAIAAGTAATFAADEELREFILDNQDDTAEDSFKAIGYFGRTEIQLGIIGTFLAAGKLTNNPRLMDTGFLGIESLLFAAAIVLPLKATIGRERPRDTDDAFDFSPFTTDNSAFPSGDTATAFALGTVIARQYERPWVSAAAYGIATLVGASRIYRNKHWLSDVVGGAVIGHLVGRFVVKMHKLRKERKGRDSNSFRWRLHPLLAPGIQSVAVSLEFNS